MFFASIIWVIVGLQKGVCVFWWVMNLFKKVVRIDNIHILCPWIYPMHLFMTIIHTRCRRTFYSLAYFSQMPPPPYETNMKQKVFVLKDFVVKSSLILLWSSVNFCPMVCVQGFIWLGPVVVRGKVTCDSIFRMWKEEWKLNKDFTQILLEHFNRLWNTCRHKSRSFLQHNQSLHIFLCHLGGSI